MQTEYPGAQERTDFLQVESMSRGGQTVVNRMRKRSLFFTTFVQPEECRSERALHFPRPVVP